MKAALIFITLALGIDPGWVRVPNRDRVAASCAEWSASHVSALKRRVSPELWSVVDEFYQEDRVVSACIEGFPQVTKDCSRHLVEEDGKKVVTYSIDCFNEGAARVSDELFRPVLAELVPMLIHGEAKLAERRAKERPEDPILEARAFRFKTMEQQWEEQRRTKPVVLAIRQLAVATERGAAVQAAATLEGAARQARATQEAGAEVADAIRRAGERTSYCTSSRDLLGNVNTTCRPGF